MIKNIGIIEGHKINIDTDAVIIYRVFVDNDVIIDGIK